MKSDGGPNGLCWISPDESLPRFYIYEPFDGSSASSGSGTMVAFGASSAEAVDQSYLGGIRSGGTDEGKSGTRDRYGKGYYGAYLCDLGGNKMHVVYRGHIL